jgi:hypothetical protein
MLLMNQMKQICGALFLSSALAACGGGGGGGSAPPSGGGTTTPQPTTVTKSFTVTVSEIDVSQTSTGESVFVDSSNVSASGTVEVSQ